MNNQQSRTQRDAIFEISGKIGQQIGRNIKYIWRDIRDGGHGFGIGHIFANCYLFVDTTFVSINEILLRKSQYVQQEIKIHVKMMLLRPSWICDHKDLANCDTVYARHPYAPYEDL